MDELISWFYPFNKQTLITIVLLWSWCTISCYCFFYFTCPQNVRINTLASSLVVSLWRSVYHSISIKSVWLQVQLTVSEGFCFFCLHKLMVFSYVPSEVGVLSMFERPKFRKVFYLKTKSHLKKYSWNS